MSRLLGLLVLASCATSGDPFADDGELAQALTPAEVTQVLDLVNYPGVTEGELDESIGLDARAARAIAAHRAGPDGRFPSLDDDLFGDLAELDALPYVGNAALEDLLVYAASHPVPASERHENIVFAGWQAEIVVWGANTVAIGTLNGLLDNRAAENVLAARPLANLAALAAVPLIGTNALGAFRGQARPWWFAREQYPTTQAGTYDGVVFDETVAQAALDIANTHSRDQMVAGGVYGNGASAIVGNRPYTTLAQVAAVAGVGASTMQGLHTYASQPD
jgi:DNA uptake protein ComE-like DNA-binding protein